MTVTRLDGCTAEPLASYLKGLAIIRLVSEQKDPSARCWWDDGAFHIESALDGEGLVRFLIDEYSPTPIVAPWNGGSGFYEDNPTAVMRALASSAEPRFSDYRRAIGEILTWPEMPPRDLTVSQIRDALDGSIQRASPKKAERLVHLLSDIERSTARVISLHPAFDPDPLSIAQLEAWARSDAGMGRGKEGMAASKVFLRALKKASTALKTEHRAAGKEHLVQKCRSVLSDRVVEWLDAAMTLGPDGELGMPPILGTGGNEGRLDYSNTFMSNIVQLLVDGGGDDASMSLLRNSLLGEPTDHLSLSKMGQFHPGRAGGFNQGPGIERKDFIANPWDFILAMEGTIAWASGVSRRNGAGSIQGVGAGWDKTFTCSPFTVRSVQVGYTSSSGLEGGMAKAEVWTPLWASPVRYPELRMFLAEGRADIGRRPARNAIEFAEAVTSLGVDRGVSQFVRYSLLRRRGDSLIALPAGCFPVEERRETDLARQLSQPLQRLDGFLRAFGREPPARFASARRDIDAALFEVLEKGGATRVKNLVMAIGRMERLISHRDPWRRPMLKAPMSGLSAGWILAADDGSLEVRIATALASVGPTGDVGPIRANLASIHPRKPWMWASGKGQRSWDGPDLAARAAGVLHRRMIDAERFGCRSNPLYGSLPIAPEDVAGFIAGSVDDGMVEDLLFGLTWVRWADRSAVKDAGDILRERWSIPVQPGPVPREWALMKLLFLPKPLAMRDGTEKDLRPEPSLVPLLRAGRVPEACRVAQRRLYVAGLNPVRARFEEGLDGTRIAAGLMIPTRNVPRLLELITIPKE